MTDLRPLNVDERVTHVIETDGEDLLRYLVRRTPSPEDAADLLGATLLVIWRRGTDLPHDPLEARLWCFGIARNTLRDHRRGTARRLALADSLRAHLARAPGAVTDDPARLAEEREEQTRVRSAVDALDGRSRELVILIHWDGFSIAEAASHLGVNESTARTRYGRARRRLAVALGG